MKYTTKLSQKRTIFKNIVAFTLIEVIITLTILGLIFGSVMSVFLLYSTLWSKVEVNRLMQSNIKTIIDHIREDVNKNGINVEKYDFWLNGTNDIFWDEQDHLYIWNNEYYLVQNYDFSKDWANQSPAPTKVSFANFNVSCDASSTDNDCTLIKVERVDENGNGTLESSETSYIPLSNSWVSFKNINFHVSKDFMPKVTVFFEMTMAHNKWIRSDLIEWSSMNIQATVSERVTN